MTTMRHLLSIHIIINLIFISSHLILSINASVVVQIREIDTSIPSSPSSSYSHPDCHFNSTPTSPIRRLTLAGPSSLHESDVFFSIAQLQLQSMQLVIDEVNKKRCGVYINGENYMLRLVSYGDESSQVVTEAIAHSFLSSPTTTITKTQDDATVNDNDNDSHLIPPPKVDAVVSGYSSYLTSTLSPIVQNVDKILVAGGAADTSIFANRDNIFGTFPPTSLYLAAAIQTLTRRTDARTIASIYEDSTFTRGVCSRVPSLTRAMLEKEGRSWEVTGMHVVPSSPSVDDFLPVVEELKEVDVDVVVTCVYAPGCEPYVKALRRMNWNPKAQILTVCVGTKRFMDEVGDDVAFMMGITPWKSRFHNETTTEVATERDEVTGWSAGEFAGRFETYAGRPATYHAASAAAAVSILIQAWERAGTIATASVRDILKRGEFTTSYGTIAFDENGQSMVPPKLIQYDPCSYEVKTASEQLIYPMPSWSWRDCHLVPTCANPEKIDLNLVDGVRLVGLTLLGINSLTSLSFFAWTVYNRRSVIIIRSQPIFLYMICLGTLITGSSIIPISIDDSIVSANGASIACMATRWLFYIGFTIMFSALFSKMLRLNQLISRNEHFRVVNVRHKDVAVTCTLLMLANLSILSVWTVKDPLLWARQPVCGMSSNVTYGHCVFGTNGHGIPLHITLSILNGGLIMLANYQAFKARKIKLEMSESRYNSFALVMIFSLMIICLPLLRLLDQNAKLKYFVTTGIIFFLCMSVSFLVFIPKCRNLRKITRSKAQQDQEINQEIGLKVEWESSSLYQHSNHMNSSNNIRTISRLSGSGTMFDPAIRERKRREIENKLEEEGINSAVVFQICQEVYSIDIIE